MFAIGLVFKEHNRMPYVASRAMQPHIGFAFGLFALFFERLNGGFIGVNNFLRQEATL